LEEAQVVEQTDKTEEFESSKATATEITKPEPVETHTVHLPQSSVPETTKEAATNEETESPQHKPEQSQHSEREEEPIHTVQNGNEEVPLKPVPQKAQGEVITSDEPQAKTVETVSDDKFSGVGNNFSEDKKTAAKPSTKTTKTTKNGEDMKLVEKIDIDQKDENLNKIRESHVDNGQVKGKPEQKRGACSNCLIF